MSIVNTAGAILVWINMDNFEVVAWDVLTFCVFCPIKDKRDSVVWRYAFVYGPAYDEHKLVFISELHNSLNYWSGPTLVGGISNLVRECRIRSNGVINQQWANLFNHWINKFG